MIHGPCGPLNPISPCMKNGKCSYNYPRALIDATRSDRNGYPLYRRKSVVNGGFQTTINAKIHNKYEKINIDNRWIVPYCPLISKIMEAHVNVELCSSVVAELVKHMNQFIDTVCSPEQAIYYPMEFLNALELSELPSHILTLKIGAPIMILRNINPPKLCNGTRLCIKSLNNNTIEGRILTGCGKGEDVFVPRNKYI
ncbi:uncharacterized protein LOC122850419 [Aphidius gifuensis]|uniref:uncharacterized protein LOC122850419 n=1 Tax=Aphidius gifuensis TaxID=684658 RepID=UPI001CDD0275|nr:uncharacterized protein LOC122850419 [Aphidius gifuensis]